MVTGFLRISPLKNFDTFQLTQSPNLSTVIDMQSLKEIRPQLVRPWGRELHPVPHRFSFQKALRITTRPMRNGLARMQIVNPRITIVRMTSRIIPHLHVMELCPPIVHSHLAIAESRGLGEWDCHSE